MIEQQPYIRDSHDQRQSDQSHNPKQTKETLLGRYGKYQQRRAEKRDATWREKQLGVIFDRAFAASVKEQLPLVGETSKISDEMRDTIIEVAQKIGKEDVLLDRKVSDEQIDRFSQTFTTLYQEFAKKHRTTISTLFKRTIVGGNLAISIAEALTAGSISAIWTDVGHNIADAYVYNEQIKNVQEPKSKKAKNYKRRKTMYAVLATASAFLATKSGIDIFRDTDSSADPLALYTSGASFAFNGGIGLARYRQIRQQKRAGHDHSHHDADVNKHLLVDSASAGLAFIGAAAGASVVGPITGVISGALGTTLFFPSESNLRHSYHAHGGDDDHHENHEHHGNHIHESKKPKRNRLKKAVATTASLAVLAGGGIFAHKSIQHETEHTTHEGISITQEQQQKTVTPKKIETYPSITTVTKIKNGGSLWQTTEEQLDKTFGKETTSVVDIVVDYATMQNALKNLDVIPPGEYKTMSSDAIKVIYDAKQKPAETQEDTQFVADTAEWNKERPSVKDEKQRKRFGRIKQYIQRALQSK